MGQDADTGFAGDATFYIHRMGKVEYRHGGGCGRSDGGANRVVQRQPHGGLGRYKDDQTVGVQAGWQRSKGPVACAARDRSQELVSEGVDVVRRLLLVQRGDVFRERCMARAAA